MSRSFVERRSGGCGVTASAFMPGVPEAFVRSRLERAAGDEIGSGRFWSPVSSAAQAANAFGWFVERPAMLPPLPGAMASVRPERTEIEYCARFPWAGGTHPWLDAALFDAEHLVGVESKRYEPLRDAEEIKFSRPTTDRCGATAWVGTTPCATRSDAAADHASALIQRYDL